MASFRLESEEDAPESSPVTEPDWWLEVEEFEERELRLIFRTRTGGGRREIIPFAPLEEVWFNFRLSRTTLLPLTLGTCRCAAGLVTRLPVAEKFSPLFSRVSPLDVCPGDGNRLGRPLPFFKSGSENVLDMPFLVTISLLLLLRADIGLVFRACALTLRL